MWISVGLSLTLDFDTELTRAVLDPFILNIVPQSLGPVVLYITAVAVGAFFLSGYIYRWLLCVAAEPPSKPHAD
jgi:hypothetical protein